LEAAMKLIITEHATLIDKTHENLNHHNLDKLWSECKNIAMAATSNANDDNTLDAVEGIFRVIP
jgi:hypothetical protein